MQTCRPAKCIEAIRVALLDPCTLLPVPGLNNGYAIGCIIEPSWDPEIEEGEESVVKDDCGNVCHRDDRCDQVKLQNVQFKIANPDPEFQALLQGDPLVELDEGEDGIRSIGVRHLTRGCSPWLFLEMFERTDDCDDAGDPIYFRHVFPAVRLNWTSNEREGVFRLLQIEGKTRAVLTDSIGVGPFHDIPTVLIEGADDLERIDYVWFEDATLPEVACGTIEVPALPTCDPDAVVVITSVTSPGPGEISVVGTGLADANELIAIFSTNHPITGTASKSYWDPASEFGPLNAAEDPTVVINAWTDTLIHVTDPNAEDLCLDLLQAQCCIDDTCWDGDDLIVDPCLAIEGSGLPGFTIAETDEIGSNLGGVGIVVDSAGRYLVAATVDNGIGDQTAGVWRFAADGTLDLTWGGGDGLVKVNTGTNFEQGVGLAIDSTDNLYLLIAVDQFTTPVAKVAKLDSAGALVGAFGVAGFAAYGGAGVAPVGKGIIVQEAQSRILVGSNDIATYAGGAITALDITTGVAVPGVELLATHSLMGFTLNGGVDLIVAALREQATGDEYLLTGDIVAAVPTETAVAGNFDWYGYQSTGGLGMAVAGDGSIYVSSKLPTNDGFAIAKFTPLLALDPGFGVAGVLAVNGYAVGSELNTIAVLAGGDILASGWVYGMAGGAAATVRASSAGVLDAGYGTGGIMEYPAFDAQLDEMFYGMLLEEGDARAVHVGYENSGTSKTVIARTLLADGSLDPTFGTP